MNIGIVSVWADCGAGYVSRAYAQVLEQWHSVDIYARGTYLSGRGDPFWDGPNVTWDSSHYGSTRLNWKQYCAWLKNNKIDLVLFNEQRWWQAVIGTRKMGIATAAYIDYYTAETVPLFKFYDGLICNTLRHFSVFKDHPKVHYIPWGTDIDLFVSGPRWAKPQEEVIFFHSAGLGGPNDRKGTGVLLEAFHR
jgi:1,2-diacylglycerol 3-alpha-glucosyltransferase